MRTSCEIVPLTNSKGKGVGVHYASASRAQASCERRVRKDHPVRPGYERESCARLHAECARAVVRPRWMAADHPERWYGLLLMAHAHGGTECGVQRKVCCCCGGLG